MDTRSPRARPAVGDVPPPAGCKLVAPERPQAEGGARGADPSLGAGEGGARCPQAG